MFPCTFNNCIKKFSSQSNLNKHSKRTHKIEYKQYVEYDYSKYSAKCNECKLSFKFIAGLREHLGTKHGFDAGAKMLFFSSETEFLSWKNKEESESCAQFAKKTGSAAGKKIAYYFCNRSQTYHSRKRDVEGNIEVRLRLPKAQGNCKLPFACTAQIIKHINNTGISVTYYATHYGHDTDIHHLRLPNTIKREIASKLISGIAINRILDFYRDNMGPDLKREDFVTRKDIRNIKRAYKIHMNTGAQHSSDTLSLEILSMLKDKSLEEGRVVDDNNTEPCCSKTLKLNAPLDGLSQGIRDNNVSEESKVIGDIEDYLNKLNSSLLGYKEEGEDSYDKLVKIREHIKLASQLLDNLKGRPPSLPKVSTETPNKRISPHRRFYYTIKKKSKKQMSKTDGRKGYQLAGILKDNKTFCLNDGSLDHKYF